MRPVRSLSETVMVMSTPSSLGLITMTVPPSPAVGTFRVSGAPRRTPTILVGSNLLKSPIFTFRQVPGIAPPSRKPP
ncbi:Uncharacterised protein [Mycobacteroides abscessus subsp. abscessus]|nr:Uncharacterised protein [Mycobacteroides abscessus subsp. abscessus]